MFSFYRVPESDDEAIAVAWDQFLKKYPTEKACFKELDRQLRNGRSHKCAFCGSEQLREGKNYRVLKCNKCKEQLWITRGSFFHRMRLARPWLARIWFMEKGVVISSLRFAKLVGIASSTSQVMFKKLAIVIEEKMAGEKVASWNFCELMCKRSRETPAREHPVSEQEEMEKEIRNGGEGSKEGEGVSKEESDTGSFHCSEPDMSFIENSKASTEANATTNQEALTGQEKLVCDLIGKEPVDFDELLKRAGMRVQELSATLVMLELKGNVKWLIGDRYIRADGGVTKLSQEKYLSSGPTMAIATSKVGPVIAWIKETFHGVSRKYLQNYLDMYWCLRDKARWRQGILLEACMRFRYVSYGEIINYVSPYMVKVA